MTRQGVTGAAGMTAPAARLRLRLTLPRPPFGDGALLRVVLGEARDASVTVVFEKPKLVAAGAHGAVMQRLRDHDGMR